MVILVIATYYGSDVLSAEKGGRGEFSSVGLGFSGGFFEGKAQHGITGIVLSSSAENVHDGTGVLLLAIVN